MSAATGRRARVHIDAHTHADVFEATLFGEHWNGWECPSFDRVNAEKVIAMVDRWNDDAGQADTEFLWTTDRDGVDCLLMGTLDGFEMWWEYVGSETEGYAIGGYSWTWVELDADAPTDPAALDAYLADADAWSARYCEVWNTALHAAYAAGATIPEAGAAARAAVAADPSLKRGVA